MKDMAMIKRLAFTFAACCLLAACESPTSAMPDNRIGVMKDPSIAGKRIALPPRCADWEHHDFEGLENHYRPQFECAQQYNLAQELVEPGDVVQGRVPDKADAVAGVAGIERYRDDKKKTLLNPKDNSATTGGE